jgi:hypothetical protein
VAETVKCTVIGPCPIVGVDGKDVNTGGTVELDPERTNVQALIDGQHVELARKSDAKTLDKLANETGA